MSNYSTDNVTPVLGRDRKYHFLYITTDPETNEWYGGRHTTANLKDSYKGSGLWIQAHPNRKKLLTKPIRFFDNRIDLRAAEAEWITIELLAADPLCRNLIVGRYGGTSPEDWTEERRKKQSASATLAYANPQASKNLSDGQKRSWQEPEVRENRMSGILAASGKKAQTMRQLWQDASYQDRVFHGLSRSWQDPEIRDKRVSGMKSGVSAAWKDPEKRARMLAGMAASRARKKATPRW